jgi:toxin ParE1/3/4
VSVPVFISPEARSDLFDIFQYIADQGFPRRALQYIDRIEKFCGSLGTFPNRGTRADHFRPGIRVLGFEKRVEIAFVVEVDAVIILRILYGGRNLDSVFGPTE